MASAPIKKPPHEILGIRPDADLCAIALAYNSLSQRWHPDRNPGDELAARRYARLTEAFEAMSRAQGFKATPDPVLDMPVQPFVYDPQGRHREYAKAEALIKARFKPIHYTTDPAALMELRVRVGRLLQDWKEHMTFLHQRLETIEEIKAARGLRLTWLKAAFRRTDDDRTLWAAERYLRSGGHYQPDNVYTLPQLGALITELRYHMRGNTLAEIDPLFVEMAEGDLRRHRERGQQALEIMQGKRKYIDFHVP